MGLIPSVGHLARTALSGPYDAGHSAIIPEYAMRRKLLRGFLVVFWGLWHTMAYADCMLGEQGAIITLTATSCENIKGTHHPEVQKYVGPWYGPWNLEPLYTGALITDAKGFRWMFPSIDSDPCREFPNDKPMKKKLYVTCCDTGRWGKCVFDGQFLGDIDGPAINTFH
jgi:hypothetical protein